MSVCHDRALHHPNLNGLVELANRDGVDIRPTLLRVMTDLYVQKPMHSEQEEQHFTELALRLIDLVDAGTRAIVANKIAGYPDRAGGGPPPLAEGADFAAGACRRRRKANRCRPTQVPADELSELFFAANAEERRLILLNLPYAPLAPAKPIAPASRASRSIGLRPRRSDTTANFRPRARAHARPSRASMARRLIDDQSGEPIVVAAVALGMPARCCSGFCCASIRRSANRCSGSMSSRCSTKRSSPTRRDGWSRSGKRATRPRNRSPAQRAAHQPHLAGRDRASARAAVTLRGPKSNGKNSRKRARPKAPSRRFSATTVSRKLRPARSSTSTIQMSGSNLIWRAR